MGCGMVRKIDELGRVVLPKEMRRILNIKTGSSVEMVIDENNRIVLSKFSEIENVLNMAMGLGKILFEKLDLKCLICDDDKVLGVVGESKKDFLGKKILYIKDMEIKTMKINMFLDTIRKDEITIYPIILQGFVKGYILVFGNNLKTNNVKLLLDYFSVLIEDWFDFKV